MPDGKATASKDAPPFDVLLEFLKRNRGFDFAGYKRTSLERRVAKRMEEAGVDDHLAYIDYLEANPAEFEALFNTVHINVTSFFRDPPTWEYMATEIIPRLLDEIDVGSHIRVWCAGCASGEETYTLAMILADALGDHAYAERVKIYATDIDDDALAQARLARYSARQVESVPPDYLERFFERSEGAWSFRKDLRRTVIFGRNDLVQDAPISRIDLLVCRNTLIYFNAETQQRVLERFNFALNPWGYILVGKSEMLLTHGDLFKAVDVRRRVFSKVAKSTMRDSLWFMRDTGHGDGDGDGDRDGRLQAGVREVAFDAAPVAQVVIDADGNLILANVAARGLLGLAGSDMGRPLKDLEMSFRPVELRSHIERAHEERRPVSTGSVALTLASSAVQHLDVVVTPLIRRDELLGTTITYADFSPRQLVEQQLEETKREVETAYEELESAVEELETTNEELQSTNEELETTNEELQSTNEELETMNEELLSTNQELETINDELRESTEQLDEVNGFLEVILTSLGMAVVVVDTAQTVRVWNSHATGLWGLRADEAVGQHLLSLDIGLPLEEVRAALRAVIEGDERRSEVMVDARNRRGQAIQCRVTCMPLDTSPPGGISGAIVLMEQVRPEAVADAA